MFSKIIYYFLLICFSMTKVFLLLLAQSGHLFLHTCVLPPSPTDGVARIFFPNYNAATGNQSHVSPVAPLWGTLNQDALPTELSLPRQI